VPRIAAWLSVYRILALGLRRVLPYMIWSKNACLNLCLAAKRARRGVSPACNYWKRPHFPSLLRRYVARLEEEQTNFEAFLTRLRDCQHLRGRVSVPVHGAERSPRRRCAKGPEPCGEDNRPSALAGGQNQFLRDETMMTPPPRFHFGPAEFYYSGIPTKTVHAWVVDAFLVLSLPAC